MVSSTLCPAVHILGSQNLYGREEGIADHYWPWAVFLRSNTLFSMSYTYFLFLGLDFLLNIDYIQPSGTILGLFAISNFPPLQTICSGFESAHYKLGTNLDFFFDLSRWYKDQRGKA